MLACMSVLVHITSVKYMCTYANTRDCIHMSMQTCAQECVYRSLDLYLRAAARNAIAPAPNARPKDL
jgi:hypothetical protein